jgi:flagellar hook-associated protein 1 FlgK
MADMLTIGSVATNTYKTALDVTSHNVANVGTEGYSRQRAEIISNSPSLTGVGFNGGGSRVDSIIRIQADYIQTQLNTSHASQQRYDQQLQLAKQVEGVVASNDEGVQAFMQRFFDSLQNLANNPTSTTNRQMVLDEAGNMQSHISNMSSVLNDTHDQVNTQIGGVIKEINDRLQKIQVINDEVSRALDTGTQPPNDLLDQRDQAILELSGYIGIKTFPQADGRIDIHTADGRLPLLADNKLSTLSAGFSPYQNENRMEIYMSVGGKPQVVSDRISGGQLGGILDFRTNMLDKAQNELGLMLNGMVASVNWQHYQGWDLNDQPGQALFAELSSTAIKSVKNDSTSSDGSGLTVSFNPVKPNPLATPEPPFTTQPATYGEKEAYLENAFSAIGQMQPREYEMVYNATNNAFDVYEKGQNTLLGSFANDPANPSVIDGLEFKGDGASYAAGDRFLVRPHQDMMRQFEAVLSDPDGLATRGQSPIDSNNDGSLDDETPAAAAFGDNVNVANLANLQSKKLLFANGNTGQASETLLGGYSKMASNVGMYVRGSDIQLTAQNNVYDQLMNQRESLSGVSLDEEAANLMKFQQAYEAAAQIIATSQSIFQTLLGVVRG